MSKLSITTRSRDQLRNPHPGEILLEEFLRPMELSQNALARAVNVPPRRVNELVLGKRAVTADTDLRLARYFGISEGFFLGLQTDFDLMQRRRQIVSELEYIYDVKIELAKAALQDTTLTGTFKKKPLDSILASICLALDLNHTREGDTYVITTKDERE